MQKGGVTVYTVAERRELVAEFEGQTGSMQSFCRERGLPYASFRNWVKEHGTPRRGVELVRVATARQTGVVVEVGAARVRVEPGFDAALLREVVAALEGGGQ